MPSLSIIVPIYNAEKYIERCTRSLMSQTIKYDIEFIFINDCTPDNSIEILRKTLEDYPFRKSQIRIVHNETNLGVALTRKKGLNLSSGEYVGWCDSDDWAEPEMFQKMYEAINNKGTDIVVTNYYIENDNGNELFKHKVSSSPQEALANCWKRQYLPLTLPLQLIKKELLINAANFFVPTIRCEDTYIIWHVYFHARTIAFVPDIYYHYERCNTTSITRTPKDNREQWELHKKNINRLSNLLLCDETNQQRYHVTVNYLKYNMKLQFRNTFNSISEYYHTFSECYEDINDILRTPKALRRKTYWTHNVYFLFWISEIKKQLTKRIH